MSSIRLFILSSFADLGPMHGHRLRLEAERKHVTLWTDISVGAVYAAMTRLALDGLLRAAGQERDGKRPTRQIYEITDDGRRDLARLRREGLTEVWFRYDPFDLALTRCDPASLATLPTVLASRLDEVRALLDAKRRLNEKARLTVGLAKHWALRHTEYRLEAEIAYLGDLLAAAEAIVADEQAQHASAAMPRDVST